MKIDITMTCVPRKELLYRTLNSFMLNLFKSNEDYRLIINLDMSKHDDVCTVEEALEIIYLFFDKEQVIYKVAKTPHFTKAVKWCFSKIKSKYVFHLEDDWELIKPLEMQDLIDILDSKRTLKEVSLRKTSTKLPMYYPEEGAYFIDTNKITYNPGLHRGAFLKRVGKALDIKRNPEAQVRDPATDEMAKIINNAKFAVYNSPDNPFVADTGTGWKRARGIKKRKSSSTTRGFTIWVPPKPEYRRVRPPILITGCARSGTSLTAGLIQLCGAWGGRLIPGASYNPKGMFENTRIRNTVIKPYLADLGVDPLGQDPLPLIDRLQPYPELRNKIIDILEKEGYESGPWYYKGAKLCLIWPIINEAFPQARWIVCRRPDKHIVASCMKATFMKGRRNPAAWHGWVHIHKNRFNEMQAAGLDMKFIDTPKLVAGDLTEFEDIAMWLNLEYSEDKVREFIDPALWHNK
jgi:hypothetical protein